MPYLNNDHIIFSISPEDKNISNSENKVCDTCIKEDVCLYKNECKAAVDAINDISSKKNVFIDTAIKCKKWNSNASRR